MVPSLISAVSGVAFTGFKYAVFNKGSYDCARVAIDLVSGALWGWGMTKLVEDNGKAWEFRDVIRGTAHIAISNLASNQALKLTNSLPLWARVAGFGVLAILGMYSMQEIDVMEERGCDIASVGAMLSAATWMLLIQAVYNRLPRV